MGKTPLEYGIVFSSWKVIECMIKNGCLDKMTQTNLVRLQESEYIKSLVLPNMHDNQEYCTQRSIICQKLTQTLSETLL